jgi:Fe2+ or Zn2+ uptake regulation protein
MIDKSYGKFYIACDGCGEELETADTFDEAKSRIDAEGWKTIKMDNEWAHLCPKCEKEI